MEQVEEKNQKKKIALVVHDNYMDELLSWANFYRDLLGDFDIYATRTTVHLLYEQFHIPVQEISAELFDHPSKDGSNSTNSMEAPIDFVLFFWDTAEDPPNDPGVKSLLDLTHLHNVPIAGNRAAADLMFPPPEVKSDSGLSSALTQ